MRPTVEDAGPVTWLLRTSQVEIPGLIDPSFPVPYSVTPGRLPSEWIIKISRHLSWLGVHNSSNLQAIDTSSETG